MLVIINPPDTSIHAQESKDDIALSEQREFEGWQRDLDSLRDPVIDPACRTEWCRGLEEIPDYQTMCNSFYGFFLERHVEVGMVDRNLDDFGVTQAEFWNGLCAVFFRDFKRHEVSGQHEWVIHA